MPMRRFIKESPKMMDMIEEAVREIRLKSSMVPDVAIILGTGLGDLAKKVEVEAAIEYENIPHFPTSTVESHAGKLLFGKLSGKKVAAMEGRFHFYEGYELQEIVFPVRVLRQLGAKILVVSNAAGGLNLDYKKGQIVLIEDHINYVGLSPLMGPNDERLGPRFPDMSRPYSERLIKLTQEAASETKLPVAQGTYMWVVGPNLETRAEYRMMRSMGADLVGMSTVPEVITACQMGMEVLGLSVVTDLCDPDNLKPVDIKEIIQTANEAGPKLDRLLEAAVKKF